MNIGWPEGILLALVALNLSVAAFLHGRPQPARDFSATLAGALIALGLLYWGGFFA